METISPESPRLDVLQQISSPSLKSVLPLRIVKRRSNSNCDGSDSYSDSQAARQFSHETDESRGSAPEPPGSEKPLTIPKIRNHRSSQIFDDLDCLQVNPVTVDREPCASRGLSHELYLIDSC